MALLINLTPAARRPRSLGIANGAMSIGISSVFPAGMLVTPAWVSGHLRARRRAWWRWPPCCCASAVRWGESALVYGGMPMSARRRRTRRCGGRRRRGRPAAAPSVHWAAGRVLPRGAHAEHDEQRRLARARDHLAQRSMPPGRPRRRPAPPGPSVSPPRRPTNGAPGARWRGGGGGNSLRYRRGVRSGTGPAGSVRTRRPVPRESRAGCPVISVEGARRPVTWRRAGRPQTPGTDHPTPFQAIERRASAALTRLGLDSATTRAVGKSPGHQQQHRADAAPQVQDAAGRAVAGAVPTSPVHDAQCAN